MSREEKYKRDIQRPGFPSEEKNKPDQRSVLIEIAVFSFNIFWWKKKRKNKKRKISRWYVRKLLWQIVSVIVRLNPNEQDFSKATVHKYFTK